MSEHALIVRHFRDWADKKGQTVDVDLVEGLLGLRSAYDDLEPTYWPPGSVEHLLLELWPAKGAVEPPDVDVVTAAIESWLKFLRSTGRMSTRSAEVKVLVKESRRAAPRMADVAADPARWSQSKVIFEHGRSQGLDLSSASSVEEAQDRLDQIMASWNSLPMHERRRLMPRADDSDLSERDRLVDVYGVDDPIVALLMSFAHELPKGELPPSRVTGPQFAGSPYASQLIGFADWAGSGQELTATDNLRLKPAREAYKLLGLDSWTRRQVEREYPDESLPGVAAVGRQAWIEAELDRPWRSASDSEALERLWWGGTHSGLLLQEGRKLVGRPPGDLSDDEWLELGIRSCYGILVWLEDRAARLALIVNALMRSYVTNRSRIGFDELDAFGDAWLFEPSVRESLSQYRIHRSAAALGLVADTGLVDLNSEGIRLTEFGDVFVSWWLKVMESR